MCVCVCVCGLIDWVPLFNMTTTWSGALLYFGVCLRVLGWLVGVSVLHIILLYIMLSRGRGLWLDLRRICSLHHRSHLSALPPMLLFSLSQLLLLLLLLLLWTVVSPTWLPSVYDVIRIAHQHQQKRWGNRAMLTSESPLTGVGEAYQLFSKSKKKKEEEEEEKEEAIVRCCQHGSLIDLARCWPRYH